MFNFFIIIFILNVNYLGSTRIGHNDGCKSFRILDIIIVFGHLTLFFSTISIQNTSSIHSYHFIILFAFIIYSSLPIIITISLHFSTSTLISLVWKSF